MSTNHHRIPRTSFLGRSAETWRIALQRPRRTTTRPPADPCRTNTGDDDK
jgi:hypothetical protein